MLPFLSPTISLHEAQFHAGSTIFRHLVTVDAFDSTEFCEVDSKVALRKLIAPPEQKLNSRKREKLIQ